MATSSFDTTIHIDDNSIDSLMDILDKAEIVELVDAVGAEESGGVSQGN